MNRRVRGIITASLQLVVVLVSGSVALLADTIHNLADASTAIPLGVAFMFAKRAPTKRFTYGYGRVEDLACVIIVAIIFGSAVVAFYTAINRLLHPHPVTHLAILAVASVIGFAGNELVAVFRIRVGKEIGIAALIADGYHARTDGWTSLAVLVGAAGVHFGFPLADPIIGLLISIAILGIVKESVIAVVTRARDGVDPEVRDDVAHSASRVNGVLGVTDVRARWIGHRMRAEGNITVPGDLSVEEGHGLAKQVEHEMRSHLKFLSGVLVHVDPAHEAGQSFHSVPKEKHHAAHQPWVLRTWRLTLAPNPRTAAPPVAAPSSPPHPAGPVGTRTCSGYASP
ncbi:cation diffusion facilitator family transporter [soil metagenome]